MRKLLIKATIFVLLNLGLLIAVEAFWPEVVTTAVHKRRIIERQLDADTLILGTSHTLMGINPELLSGHAVNLANTAQDIYYDCALARLYTPRMPNLKRVIIEISFFTWEYSMENNPEWWRRDLYNFAFHIPPYHPGWDLRNHSRLAAFGYERVLLRQASPNPFRPDGWQPTTSPFQPGSGKNKADLYLQIRREAWAPINEGLVVDLVRDLAKRGVEVVLVQMPAHESYRKELQPEADLKTKESTRRVIEKTGVRFLDYLADPRFTIDDFVDGDHINEQGSRKFTKILDADLRASTTAPVGSGP
ncbi:MAG: hypothetical protein NTW19_12710 [Planctomycetota bacterium]|nr:hypothetical protein [Planctomycetota bacterium]